MKGFLLSIFYTSKKTLISYFIVSIVVTVIFSFLNPLMTCFMPMVFLLSPITDNIKHEKILNGCTMFLFSQKEEIYMLIAIMLLSYL